MNRTKSSSARQAPLMAAMRFVASPIVESCYALGCVCDDAVEPALHQAWTNAARKRLSPAFWRRFREMGAWPKAWILIPDLLAGFDPQDPIDAVVARVKAIPPAELAAEFVGGVLHPRPLLRRVVSGELSLAAAVGKASPVHREWLLFAGLYPFDAGAPVARALQFALDSPVRLRDSLVAMLQEFWSTVFRDTWRFSQARYERSAAEKARLQAASTPQQLADELRLRVEINLPKGYVQAVRGGYRLPIAQLDTMWMMPSAFNIQHLWHALESHGRATALFPYFDPAIELGIAAPGSRGDRSIAVLPLDPALVFRALADTARYSMVLLLGTAPRTATELGQALSLSKGTVSHHVHILREAGVVTRSLDGNVMLLQLDRGTLEQLSTETLKAIDRGADSGAARPRKRAGRR